MENEEEEEGGVVAQVDCVGMNKREREENCIWNYGSK